MIYRTIVALSLAAAASAALFTEDPTHQKYMWESFKKEHHKSYKTMEEETHRFAMFLENLKMADHRNFLERKAGGSAVHGITRFSDLSQAEFESQFLNADVGMKTGKAKLDTTKREVDTTAGLVSWVGIYTTPVKDQGYCGSCWAFSATEQIESDTMRTQDVTYILSPEQVTQCTTTCDGCNGGWTESAYEYVHSVTGIVQDSDYPYTSYNGVTGTCAVNTNEAVVSLLSYSTISGETNMAAYVQTTGPLSVCLDASSWNSYTGGIMYVCGKDVDHCVQAVGVDTTSPGGYWLVRNQWGTSWGESGYIQLAYGQNTCNISNDPTYTSVALVPQAK